MKHLLIVAAFICAAGAAMADTAPAAKKSDQGKLKSDLRNEDTIRQLYAEFCDTWNKHDPKAMAGRWLEDGDEIEPDGHVAKGRAEMLKMLTLQHQSVFKNSHLTLTVETVWFITSEVALIDGSYEVTGVQTPDGKDIPARKGHLSSILLQEGGKWWIAASRLMIPTALPYKKD